MSRGSSNRILFATGAGEYSYVLKRVTWTGCFAWMIIAYLGGIGRRHGSRGWLRSLGLEQYEAVFRQNAVVRLVLPDLTDQDLERARASGCSARAARRLLRSRITPNLESAEKGASAISTAAGSAASVAQEDCRAPSGHSDVLGPCWFDGALRPHGPGGLTRGHCGLSQTRRRDRPPLRRLRGAVPGRRRAGVFRLSAGP